MTTHKCSCCSFTAPNGVLTNNGFICTRCFSDPNLFFSAKRILPHWTLAVKIEGRVNVFGKCENGDKAMSGGYFSKRAKRELATSEALYSGQRQLGVFTCNNQ